ncbi:acyltransferase [Pseudomonas nitroreducens]|uniref:acyltransferase family protein n=1 Tax=Pseudomonas nitroreducens TaxID=46680 RepID=UPI002FE0A9A4
MHARSLGQLFESERNNLNLIRLLAAFSVIYGHASAITGHGPADIFLQYIGFKFIGGVAVDVFFVVSGFLITASAASHGGIKYYLASRVLRIYPALIVCICFTVLIAGPLLTTSSAYWVSAETWAYFWKNITLANTVYNLPGVFENIYSNAVNGSLWSLYVEVRLYAIVALVSVVGVLGNRAVFNLIFFVVLVSGFLNPEVWSFILAYENHRHVALMFMIGSFAWVNRDSLSLSPWVLMVLLFCAAATYGAPTFGLIYNLLLPYVVFCLAFCPGGGWFNKFSDYSYGVYLYGWLSQQLVMSLYPAASNMKNTLLSCMLAFMFAVVSWHFIERPAMRLRLYFKRRAPIEGCANYA